LGEEGVGGKDLEMLKFGLKKSGVTIQAEPMKLGKRDLRNEFEKWREI
jgi:hypothetical protein